jgi:hypothetical protein
MDDLSEAVELELIRSATAVLVAYIGHHDIKLSDPACKSIAQAADFLQSRFLPKKGESK